jgi:hypothetical protein
MVVVMLFGAGAPEYFDLATFSFQVPIAGSVCADNNPGTMTARTATLAKMENLFMGDAPSFLVLDYTDAV